MKKILHIVVLPEFAGAQTIAYQILQSLSCDEYDKTIMFSCEGTTQARIFMKQSFEKIGVKTIFSEYLVREINLKKDFCAIREIYKLCKKERFDIVHTHSTKPGIVGDIAARIAKVPLVVHTVHGLAFHKFLKFPKWQLYYLCEMFAACFRKKNVLVNQYYSRYFKWFKSKTLTIYNGVEFSKFDCIKSNKNESNKINVLFVGRLDTPKNPLCLLEAAKIVIENNSNVEFTLVGNGKFYDDCKNFIEVNHLTENVKMAGWQNNPGKFYADADIFAASSIYESFGLMFIEAGYFALPVCATNVEGIPEVVKHGISGLLCEPNDATSLAKNILTLCYDEDMRTRMGKENHRISVETFSINKMTEAYKSVYQSLLK